MKNNINKILEEINDFFNTHSTEEIIKIFDDLYQEFGDGVDLDEYLFELNKAYSFFNSLNDISVNSVEPEEIEPVHKELIDINNKPFLVPNSNLYNRFSTSNPPLAA